MKEGDSLFLSKFSIDAETDSDFDNYDIPEFDFGPDIDHDLHKIEIECGRNISIARLKARPVAKRCIKCKTKQEKTEKSIGA